MTSRTHRHGVAAIACTVLLQLIALQPAHAAAAADTADTVDARALVEHAIELTRSRGSVSELTMNVHRPDWQRTSSLKLKLLVLM